MHHRSRRCPIVERRQTLSISSSSSSSSFSSTSTASAAATDSADAIPAFIPQEFGSEVTEPAARRFIARMRRVELPVEGVSSRLATAFVGPDEGSPSSSSPSSPALPPVVCLHGFDSSCLEFRRLEPLLAERGIECWCPDLIGWGFTSLADFKANGRSRPTAPSSSSASSSSSSSSSSASSAPDAAPLSSLGPEEKRLHLLSFWENVLKRRKMVLLGTSLGGGIAIDFAVSHPETVEGLVLVAPQAYAEGIGPLSAAPRWLARLGVKLLRSVPLRQAANKMAYYNVEEFATEDAMRVGRLHTHLPGWEEGNVAFMASGGYSLGPEAVRAVACARTLLVWGENDEILPPATLVEKFREDLPKGNGRTEFVSVAECGHCPHLEQPEKLAEAVAAFVKGGGGGGGGSGGGES